MGKRSYDYVVNKLRKLERRFKKARREKDTETSSSSSSPSSESSDSDSGQPTDRQCSRTRPEPLYLEDVPKTSAAKTDCNAAAASPAANCGASTADPQPSTSAVNNNVKVAAAAAHSGTNTADTQPSMCAINNTVDVVAAAVASITDPQSSIIVVDNESNIIKELLGDDPSMKKVYGDAIQADLAIRLQHTAKNGLSKDIRKDLLDKYLTPENCTLIDAPTLNPEIKAATVESILKRDKGIELRQKQIAAVTTCVARTLTDLLVSEPRNTGHIHMLMDALKLLCDSQFNDSTVRRNFILASLKKELKDQLQTTKIDELLFSKELADTLKNAKAIIKTGQDMKPAKAKSVKANTIKPNKSLNWRGPPQQHRQKGNLRTKEPAYNKRRQENSSKQSSRPAQSRSRH